MARYAAGGAGTSTAALFITGRNPIANTAVESWNGSSWTEIADINTGRYAIGATGTQTAAIAMGGTAIPPQATGLVNNELWNGNSWTEVGDLNTARYAVGSSSSSSTDALVFGGYVTSPSSVTEAWNGTSWTEVNDLATARNFAAGAGTASDSIVAGNSADTNATEEWSFAHALKTIDVT